MPLRDWLLRRSAESKGGRWHSRSLPRRIRIYLTLLLLLLPLCAFVTWTFILNSGWSQLRKPSSMICAHKAFLPPSSPSPLAPSFPPAPSHPNAGFSPPMLTSAVMAFLSHGVSCFDVDLFWSSDDVLFFGHPTDSAAYLSAAAGTSTAAPVPSSSSAPQYVETLSSASIASLDPQGYVLPFTVFVSSLSAYLDAQPSLSISLFDIEPKGRLNSPSGHLVLAAAISAIPNRTLRDSIVLLVDSADSAQAVMQQHPGMQLGLPLRDRGVKEGSSAWRVCSPHLSRQERMRELAPYRWVWPSDKSIVACGRDGEGGDDLIQAARRQGKRVGTWVVDDASAAVAVMDLADFIISNVPFDVIDGLETRLLQPPTTAPH